jgi:hypothetical protein
MDEEYFKQQVDEWVKVIIAEQHKINKLLSKLVDLVCQQNTTIRQQDECIKFILEEMKK